MTGQLASYNPPFHTGEFPPYSSIPDSSLSNKYPLCSPHSGQLHNFWRGQLAELKIELKIVGGNCQGKEV